jgi:hypothetical protein
MEEYLRVLEEGPATWEFEAADPEVGFLTDTVTHTCAANLDDAQPAEVADVTRVNVQRRTRDGGTETVVAETTTMRCPACSATTAITEHWPLWFFAEPRDEEEGR